jgi:hypothetical protein
VIKRLRGRRISSKLIQRRAKTAGQGSVKIVDRKTAEAKQAQAKKDYKDLKKQPMRRIKWLTGLSAALAAENKTTAAQEKENYIRREEQRKFTRHFKRE